MQIPVLIWNQQNEWASFVFHLKERHEHGTLRPLQYLANLGSFVGAQVLLGGVAFVIAAFFAWKPWRENRIWRSTTPGTPLWAWIVPTFFVFGSSAMQGESRFYWTTVAYPAICVVLALPLARLFPLKKMRFRKAQSWGLAVSLSLVAFILWFPIGAYLKPLTDTYKPYDLRVSPRGDLTGWEQWVEEDLRPQGLINDEVAFLATDFRLSSQIAWTARIHDMSRVGTVNHQSQFHFWKRPHPSRFHTVVFFGDNRRSPGPIFGNYCGHPLTWSKKDILLRGEKVKEIDWTVCRDFRWDAIHTASWRY